MRIAGADPQNQQGCRCCWHCCCLLLSCRRCGCSEVILYSQEDVVQRVMQLTQGKGVKVSTQQRTASVLPEMLHCTAYDILLDMLCLSRGYARVLCFSCRT
jgi:hypothetical protein